MNTASLTWTSNENSNQRWTLREPLLAMCFLAIVYVSILDTWFAVQNPEILRQEKNPVCEMLMQLDPQGFSWFVAAKVAGNILCIGSLVMMFRLKYRNAGMVLASVTLFQVGLLGWLVLSDPRMSGLPNLSLLFTDTRESIWHLQ